MLFDKFSTPSLQLANRMVMAPLTRNRATPQHTPNALMATYYGQRATAGLIITEGTSPSPNGLGYPRIPGLFEAAQAEAWKATTTAVHKQSGKIFVQFMHCGRVAHIDNLPTGAEVLGPSSEVCPGEMYTDTQGLQPHSPPRAMTADDIAHVIDEHVLAAKLAMDAGFDGVELHGANGYLIEQFLNPLVNQRTDGYGGSVGNRLRFHREALDAVRAVWPERLPLTMRLGSDDLHPDGVQFDDSVWAVGELKGHGLDLADLSLGMNTDDLRDPPFSQAAFMVERGARVRREVGIPVAVSWNLGTPAVADRVIREELIDLVFLGRPALANPHWPIWAARELSHNDPFSLLPQDWSWWLKNRPGSENSHGWPAPTAMARA